MTIIQAQVTEQVLQQLQTIAQQESLSLEQLVERALAMQVTAWMERDELTKRGSRGSWEHFQQVLAQVPDVEAEAYDRL
jgi:hypothetical protein